MEEPADLRLSEVLLIPKLDYSCTYFSSAGTKGITERKMTVFLVSSVSQISALNAAYSLERTSTQVNMDFMRKRLEKPLSRDRYLLVCTTAGDYNVIEDENEREISRTPILICVSKQFVSPRRGLSFIKFRWNMPVEIQPPKTMLPLFKTWLEVNAKPILS